jgi:FkbM family methyltransferase
MNNDLYFREKTWDKNIWKSVVEHDEYGLNNYNITQHTTAIDIGAHIGGFTYYALNRGIGKIISCEPSIENFHLLQHNIHQVCRASDRALLIPCAVGGSKIDSKSIAAYADVGTNTGGGNTLGTNGQPVLVLGLDAIIDLMITWSKKSFIDIMKIDCEGSEYQILFESNLFTKIKYIVGEFHNLDDICNIHSLSKYLGYNYSVKFEEKKDIGRFSALLNNI